MKKENQRKDVERVMLGVAAKALGNLNDIYIEGWPPICATYLHQPKRPVSDKEKF